MVEGFESLRGGSEQQEEVDSRRTHDLFTDLDLLLRETFASREYADKNPHERRQTAESPLGANPPRTNFDAPVLKNTVEKALSGSALSQGQPQDGRGHPVSQPVTGPVSPSRVDLVAPKDSGTGSPTFNRSEVAIRDPGVAGGHSDVRTAPAGKADTPAPAKDVSVTAPVKNQSEIATPVTRGSDGRSVGTTAPVAALESPAQKISNAAGISPVRTQSEIAAPTATPNFAGNRLAGETVPAGKSGAGLPKADLVASGPSIFAGHTELPVAFSRSLDRQNRQPAPAQTDHAGRPAPADRNGSEQLSPGRPGITHLAFRDPGLIQKASASPGADTARKDGTSGPGRVAETVRAEIKSPGRSAVDTTAAKDAIAKTGDSRQAGPGAEKNSQLKGRSDPADKLAPPPQSGRRLDVAGNWTDGLKTGDPPAGTRAVGAPGGKGDVASGTIARGGRIVDPPVVLPPAGIRIGPFGLADSLPVSKGVRDGSKDPGTAKDGKPIDSKGIKGEPPIILPPGSIRIGRFFPPEKGASTRSGKEPNTGIRNADGVSNRAPGRDPASVPGKADQRAVKDPGGKTGKVPDARGDKPSDVPVPVIMPPGGIRIGAIFQPGKEGGPKHPQSDFAPGKGEKLPGKDGDVSRGSGLRPGAKEVPVDKQGRPIEGNADRFSGLPIVQGPPLPWLGVRITEPRAPRPLDTTGGQKAAGDLGPVSGKAQIGADKASGERPGDARVQDSAAAPSKDYVQPGQLDEEQGASDAPSTETAAPVKLFRLPDLLITGPMSVPKFRKPAKVVPVVPPVEYAETSKPAVDEQQETPVLESDTRGKLLGYEYSLLEHEDRNKEPVPGANYVVQPGDTLESIASRVFADTLIALLLLETNKQTIPIELVDGRLVVDLKPGTVICLPGLSRVRQFRERLASSTASIFDYAPQKPPQEDECHQA